MVDLLSLFLHAAGWKERRWKIFVGLVSCYRTTNYFIRKGAQIQTGETDSKLIHFALKYGKTNRTAGKLFERLSSFHIDGYITLRRIPSGNSKVQ